MSGYLVPRYYFHVCALDYSPNPDTGSGREELENAMAGHVLAEGIIMGRYQNSHDGQETKQRR